jgi:hypothetical protein
LASGESDNSELVAAFVDIDTVVPYDSQTSVAADIDRAMSCLQGFEEKQRKKGSNKRLPCQKQMFDKHLQVSGGI